MSITTVLRNAVSAYEERKESIGKFAQLRKVKIIKETNPYAKNIHSHVLQVAIADLERLSSLLPQGKSG
ncbi:MAG: hypothetical protein NTZ74_04975 [Chloroflexi bacterium]|nr:hypothetical protein [Chloroflexota bacterium]